MDILITDVTEMSAGTYCVAGWDIGTHRMVRPLPAGSNWPTALVQQHSIVPGRLIRVHPVVTPIGERPHGTEDTWVDASSIVSFDGIFSDWLGGSAPEIAGNLSTGFGGQLLCNSEWNGVKQGVHTQPGADCKSLVAVRILRPDISFSYDLDKLRAVVDDGSDQYRLPVSCTALKEAFRAGGFAGVNNALPRREELIVRVGLARAFGNPPRCYAMLNGLL
jgi:hypothetical protein